MNRRHLTLATIAGLTALLVSAPATAQVGYDPDQSPYRDLRIKRTLTFFGGYMLGGEGKAGVGPSTAPLAGARFDLHVGGATSLFLGGTYAPAERSLVNPDDPPETRYFETVTHDLFIIEGGLNLLLTGRKTWRGLAPYGGVSLGVVLGATVPGDSLSGFTFRNKFHIGPQIGVRIFPTTRIHLRLEARDILWRLNYGSRFFGTPANSPSSDPVLNPLNTKNSEWVHNVLFLGGLGWTF